VCSPLKAATQQLVDFPAAQRPADHLLGHLAGGACLVERVRLDEFASNPAIDALSLAKIRAPASFTAL
jgi:hypothetical protein